MITVEDGKDGEQVVIYHDTLIIGTMEVYAGHQLFKTLPGCGYSADMLRMIADAMWPGGK